MLLAMIGNGLMIPRALLIRDFMWYLQFFFFFFFFLNILNIFMWYLRFHVDDLVYQIHALLLCIYYYKKHSVQG